MLEGAALGHVADKVANAFILTGLAEWRPDDAVLSEESPDDPARLAHARVWIIDPLDGTREYAEGRSDWAVHVALAVDGAPRLGAVARARARPAVPLRPGDGAARRSGARPIMLVSRTRPPAEAEEIAALLGAELVPMGSAGAKAMAVVAGEADLYYHAGGQHEWDNCAPAAVALGAGLHASRLDGSPLVYNQARHLDPGSRHRPARACGADARLLPRSADVRSDSERIAPGPVRIGLDPRPKPPALT